MRLLLNNFRGKVIIIQNAEIQATLWALDPSQPARSHSVTCHRLIDNLYEPYLQLIYLEDAQTGGVGISPEDESDQVKTLDKITNKYAHCKRLKRLAQEA